MLRKWCIPVASLAIAGVPALAAFAASGPAATAVTAAARPASGTGRVTITHGPAVRNGGVGLELAKPGGKPLSESGGIAREATSTNWSGYAASGGPYTSVSASWVQPTGQCSGENGDYSSFWVGLDGYSSNSVEQTGTDTDCINGSAQYYGWYEMYPNPSNSFGHSISPGDTINATVTYAGSNKYTLTLADSTAGWSTSTSQTLSGAPRGSAEVIVEAPSSITGVLPLADFGTVNISDALVDGSPIGNDSPAEIAMVNSGGTSKDTISPLNGGENFSATWEGSN
jgi:peptidase A4-like protein